MDIDSNGKESDLPSGLLRVAHHFDHLN
jgi:hypothetical protein